MFAKDVFLVEPMESPYLDEFGEPCCPIELVSAYIDRENNRYGEVAAFLDLQDEINKRRSKALHFLSQRQTFGTQGAIKDVMRLKSELAKPDGHIQVNTGEFNKDFGILPTSDMATAQLELLREAKSEIDAQSYNAQLSGERQSGDLSGRAIQKLQQAGMNELNSLFHGLNNLELRIYRQVWARIKQFWTEERWVRVTDDQDSLRWVGLNSEVTIGKLLQETMDDDSLPHETRVGAAAMQIQLEQENPQALEEVVEISNDVAELDMDIILDQSFDTVNVQQEQFELIMQFGAHQNMDIIDLIEMSQIRGKDDLIERIEKRRKEQAESQQQAQQIQIEGEAVKLQETASKAALNQQNAQQKQVETQMMLSAPPDPEPQLIV